MTDAEKFELHVTACERSRGLDSECTCPLTAFDLVKALIAVMRKGGARNLQITKQANGQVRYHVGTERGVDVRDFYETVVEGVRR